MKDLSKDIFNPIENEKFEDLFNKTLGKQETLQGFATKGTITNVISDFVLVDVGLKSEGRVPLREFGANKPNVGDIIDVFVERYESKDGTAVLSYAKARAEKAWKELEKIIANGEDPEGTIIEAVRGGFTVDINGVFAFMPSSQADTRPIHDMNSMVGLKDKFRVLKMDTLRSNAIVSRRAIMEADHLEAQKEIMKKLTLNSVVEGTVKNITDYGVFVDLGGVDGLLHVTDLSWKRVNHPKEILSIGDVIKVKIIQFDSETNRISLGMKQLEEDPWLEASKTYSIGDIIEGKISSLTDYGAFIDLGNNLEGLVHMSEISWTNKNINPSKVLKAGDKIKVMVLGIDMDKRRISLGIKQCIENPWAKYAEEHKVGEIVSGTIKNMTEFGLFVSLTDELDGMVHISDLSWDIAPEQAIKEYSKGNEISAKILDISADKERITLGIKQLTEGSDNAKPKSLKKGVVVDATVVAVAEDHIDLKVGDIDAVMEKKEISREKAEQNTSKFKEGDVVTAEVLSCVKNLAKLSIRAYEIKQEKEAVKEYATSADSGSVLGDILGEAIAEQKEKKAAKKKTTK